MGDGGYNYFCVIVYTCSPGSQLDEDEVISDDDIEDCLGFVSSVAEANDVNWHDKHSGRNQSISHFVCSTLYSSHFI